MHFQGTNVYPAPAAVQGIGTITSNDSSVVVTNPIGPTTDLSVQLKRLLGIPPPLTSGSAVQSFTDTLGDVWVAKNGVNGGNWFRARDVLYARWYRSTALNSGAVPVLFDTMLRDPYGLYAPATGYFTPPIAGLYDFMTQTQFNCTAAGQAVGARIYTTGTFTDVGGAQSGFAGTAAVTPFIAATRYVTPSDYFYAMAIGNVVLALAPGSQYLWASLTYRGTG